MKGVHLWNKPSAEWLRKGVVGEHGGWVQSPLARGILLLSRCLGDEMLAEPWFYRDYDFTRASTTAAATSTTDVREADYLLCPSGEYCGK